MKTMWAPWRMEYILDDKPDGCVFCFAMGKQDDLTLYKGRENMVMMNKYPYINGHLLVAPVRHIPTLHDLARDEMGSLLFAVERAMEVLKKAMRPDGFNVGLNVGRVAGAGVEEHLHFHIVPRWSGDTNAFTVFADVRVIPEHIEATFHNLKGYFNKLDMA